DEAHTETQYERHRERKLGQKHERINDVDVRQIYALDEFAMKRERRMLAHLPGPIIEPAGNRQWQLPEATLEPLRADQQTANPGDHRAGAALLRILRPVLVGDPHTREE